MANYNKITLKDGSVYPIVEELGRNKVGIKIRSYGASKTYIIPRNAVKEVVIAEIEKQIPAFEECKDIINSFGIEPSKTTRKYIMYKLNDKLAVKIYKKRTIYKVELIRFDIKRVLDTYINPAQLYRIEILIERIKEGEKKND